MPKAYSMDLRERVAAMHADTGSSARTAAHYGVSESWVRDLVRRQRAAGTLAPRPAGRKGDQRAYDDADEAKIRDLIKATPDLILAEVAGAVGKPASLSAVCRTLARLGLPRKKSRSGRPSRTGRTWPSGGPAGPTGSAVTGRPT